MLRHIHMYTHICTCRSTDTCMHAIACTHMYNIYIRMYTYVHMPLNRPCPLQMVLVTEDGRWPNCGSAVSDQQICGNIDLLPQTRAESIVDCEARQLGAKVGGCQCQDLVLCLRSEAKCFGYFSVPQTFSDKGGRQVGIHWKRPGLRNPTYQVPAPR